MKKIVTVDEAEDLLRDIQIKIRQNGIIFMNGREKNRQTLAKLGIMATQQKEIISQLRAEDYCAGPGPDEKYPWKSVSVFGTVFRGIELYIKFSIGAEHSVVVCISFHEAEWPMLYQFK